MIDHCPERIKATCAHCGETYNARKIFVDHIVQEHGEYICPDCLFKPAPKEEPRDTRIRL